MLMVVGGEALWVKKKSLLCKHQDLSLILRTHIKGPTVCYVFVKPWEVLNAEGSLDFFGQLAQPNSQASGQ